LNRTKQTLSGWSKFTDSSCASPASASIIGFATSRDDNFKIKSIQFLYYSSSASVCGCLSENEQRGKKDASSYYDFGEFNSWINDWYEKNKISKKAYLITLSTIAGFIVLIITIMVGLSLKTRPKVILQESSEVYDKYMFRIEPRLE